ncbi:hypothetical protein J6590_071907 [Homalodisca vitripennis]|nr:hypothetical protein J6590_071907 [Homalodisca vitripennis]
MVPEYDLNTSELGVSPLWPLALKQFRNCAVCINDSRGVLLQTDHHDNRFACVISVVISRRERRNLSKAVLKEIFSKKQKQCKQLHTSSSLTPTCGAAFVDDAVKVVSLVCDFVLYNSVLPHFMIIATCTSKVTINYPFFQKEISGPVKDLMNQDRCGARSSWILVYRGSVTLSTAKVVHRVTFPLKTGKALTTPNITAHQPQPQLEVVTGREGLGK